MLLPGTSICGVRIVFHPVAVARREVMTPGVETTKEEDH